MKSTSVASTSAVREPGREATPSCVRGRARELLDRATLKVLALCLGGCAGVQLLALSIALLSPPHLHYIPEVGA